MLSQEDAKSKFASLSKFRLHAYSVSRLLSENKRLSKPYQAKSIYSKHYGRYASYPAARKRFSP